MVLFGNFSLIMELVAINGLCMNGRRRRRRITKNKIKFTQKAKNLLKKIKIKNRSTNTFGR